MATLAGVDGEEPVPPHYGHRKRLRECFRTAGGDAVSDYELLELVLFRAILTERFGWSSGDVLDFQTDDVGVRVVRIMTKHDHAIYGRISRGV